MAVSSRDVNKLLVWRPRSVQLIDPYAWLFHQQWRSRNSKIRRTRKIVPKIRFAKSSQRHIRKSRRRAARSSATAGMVEINRTTTLIVAIVSAGGPVRPGGHLLAIVRR